MIDDAGHDLAIEYLLGGLEGDALREFEAWMQSDAELRRLVDDLRESLAAVAYAAPVVTPRPELRARVLSIIDGEAPPLIETAAPARRARAAWLPWALAAGLAITTGFIFKDRARWHSAATRLTAELQHLKVEAHKTGEELSSAAERLLVFEAQARSQAELVTEMRTELTRLRGRDALAQVRIATLTAQVTEFARAGVTIVWDAEEQRGVIKLANLQPAGAGKDYQLWVIDPKYPAPVNSGVLPVEPNGTAKLIFKPDQPIGNADKFAISVEQAGGVPSAHGPIVFIGD